MRPRPVKGLNICVLGDGGWGTTIAVHLAKKGHRIVLWGAFPEYIQEIREKRENPKFLPGVHIPENVFFETRAQIAVASSHIVFLASPSKFLRKTLQLLDPLACRSKIFVILAKGLEPGTSWVMSRVLEDELGKVTFAVVSGPCIAVEVAREIPTAVAVASGSSRVRLTIRRLLESASFTLLETDDVVGVQLGGSVKNVIAIAAGILDGLGYGSNTKSVLLARGIAEIARLGRVLKAKQHTFLGLSGLGDLATTCFSIHSRNHQCGYDLGKGMPLKSVLNRSEMVIEGVETAKAAYALSGKHKIHMPIVKSVYEILFQHRNPKTIIDALMHKEFIREID